MYSRWSSVAVVVLWLSAMGWLVAEKVLPPMLVGRPPSYQTIVKAHKQQPLVGWVMLVNESPAGWALNLCEEQPNGLTEICSRVHFDHVPLQEVLPSWLPAKWRSALQQIGERELDIESLMIIDPLGRLSRFDTAVRFESLEHVTKLHGTIDGNTLELLVTAGDFSHPTKHSLPSEALIGDSLAPQTHLPGLQLGQTWKVRSYSSLPQMGNSLETLQAKVEGTDSIRWNGKKVHVWLVVYRSDPGSTLGSNKDPRGRLWVRPDGTVLKQQMTIQNAVMTFIRLPDDEAAAIEKRIGGVRWSENAWR